LKPVVKKIMLWCLAVWGAALICVTAPLIVLTLRESRSVDRAFAEYASSLVAQRFDVAYGQCGTEFRKAVPLDQFSRLYGSLRDRYGALKSVENVTHEVHGRGRPMYWRAVIDATFIYERKSLRFELVFHKEGSRWVIYSSEQL